MHKSQPAPVFLRSTTRRRDLPVAVRAMLVLGLLTVPVGCAPSPRETEDFGSTSSALGVAGLFSTGVDATGAPLAIGAVDPHYVLTSDDPARPGPQALAIAPVSGWVGNTLTSNWIGAQANAVAASDANYTYTTTFSLSGVDPAKVIISGSWACDDSCVIQLNGTLVASYAAPASMAVAAFTIPAGSPFVTGTNTLAFVVTNGGDATSGLQVVSISGTSFRCTADDQCGATQFCNTQTGSCVSMLPNGTPIPTISGHTPVLDGICGSGVGASVCQAGVCDTSNNECGLADGDGPCTPSTGPLVCQSGACSVNDTCEPQGGCNADGDCSGGEPCDVATHQCVASPDGGADGSATAEAGVDASGADASPVADGGPDSAVASDGSEGDDGSTSAEGSTDATVLADGESGTDGSAIEDGGPEDAPEGDANARGTEDAGQERADAGVSQNKVLEGDGLSCSAARVGWHRSSGLPMLAVAIAMALGRRRRDQTRRSAGLARSSVGERDQ